MKLLVAVASLFLCGSLVAGCGGSRHLSLAAERAAVAAAQRQNDNLRVFPISPGTKTCNLPPSGGPQSVSNEVSGHCTTRVSAHGSGSRVDFIQRATVNGHAHTGDWIYYLDRHNGFVHFHPSGWLPQDEP
jgi:hypothetical protein